jgi:hypothetical protein
VKLYPAFHGTIVPVTAELPAGGFRMYSPVASVVALAFPAPTVTPVTGVPSVSATVPDVHDLQTEPEKFTVTFAPLIVSAFEVLL